VNPLLRAEREGPADWVSLGRGRGSSRAMYVLPLIVIILLAIVAVAWSPIFAVVFFAIFFVLFLGFVGLSRRADQGAVATPEARAAERGRQEEAETRIR
jgi:hypothetical protein